MSPMMRALQSPQRDCGSTRMDDTESLPSTVEACSAEMNVMKADIAEIKDQLWRTSLDRQKGVSVDRSWEDRARTAMRHKQRRYDALLLQRQTLTRSNPVQYKDVMIETAREYIGETMWADIAGEAYATFLRRRDGGSA